MRRLLALAVLLTAFGVVPAFAADPPSGEVSKSSVQVKWSGETTNGGATTITAITLGGAPICEAPTCDKFALTVRDSDRLTITATAGIPFTMVEVVLPDGSKIYNGGSEEETSTQVQIPNAPTGVYEVRVALNSIVTTSQYTAMAVLGPVDPKGRPAPPASPPPPSQPRPEPQPAQSAGTMSIKTTSASARRVKRSLKIAVESSQPVTAVKGTLKKGKRTLGTGKLARIEGRATISLRLKRKLKPGRYTVRVTGKDPGGRVVGAAAPLRVGR